MARDAIFRASVRGARRPGFRLSRAGQTIQRELLDHMGYRLAPTATRLMRSFAPHDSGRLERGLKATVGSRGGRITVTVISTATSEAGYPYTGVTRFGHRVAWIRPTGGRQFLRFRGAAGQWVFARQVRGQRRSVDWAELGAHAIDREIDHIEDEVGRAIVSRLL